MSDETITPPDTSPVISAEGMPSEEDEVSQGITVRKLDIRAFREAGFLHEINRLILHPCGLALEIAIDPATGEEKFGGVWDCTDDPEGVLYGEDYLSVVKAQNVAEIIEHRGRARAEALGYVIQPLPPEVKQLNLTVKELIASREAGPTIALNGADDEGEETPA
jgi:hypothetical protein